MELTLEMLEQVLRKVSEELGSKETHSQEYVNMLIEKTLKDLS